MTQTQTLITDYFDILRKKAAKCYYTSKKKKDAEKVAHWTQFGTKIIHWRVMILVWLTDICQYYELHRETYCLAKDYFDRYLSVIFYKYELDLTTTQFMNENAELIGLTCLFIAAKYEEIYPPNIQTFAWQLFRCEVADILKTEIEILIKLKWQLSSVTTNYWLNFYFQLIYHGQNGKLPNCPKECPEYSHFEFVQVAQLIDKATLAISSRSFSYKEIVVTALCFYVPIWKVIKVTGYKFQDLEACYMWMAPLQANSAEVDISRLPFNVQTLISVG